MTLTAAARLSQALTAALLGLIGIGGPSQAAAPARPVAGIEGTVTSVVDGDSLWLTPAAGGKAIEVRLAGIDAPEICQDGGAEAKAYLAELALKKPARLVPGGVGPGGDPYGRTLGTLFVDGIEVNRRLVEEGQAWSLRVKWDQGPYVVQERMARALSRGVHKAGSAALQPRDFRLRHGPCAVAGAASVAPAPAPPAAPRAGAAAAPAGPYRCDGRIHCSQMSSCAEATWFLQHCPGTKMDGDGDGVPCELQWCGAGRR
jgi:endonuclease YncB( thermonuclease family)